MFEQAPGYLDMIRTNIYRWPLHRALFGYRYVFKLDSDAALVERIDVDMFEDMKSRDIKAAYVTSIMSSKIMSEKLYETAEDILRYNMLKPAQDLDRMPKLWTCRLLQSLHTVFGTKRWKKRNEDGVAYQ
ncbi:hypothetical protein VYU27_010302 [Nannochloropsis oceanica]